MRHTSIAKVTEQYPGLLRYESIVHRLGGLSYIVALFLANLADLAFDTFPRVGSNYLGDLTKLHAAWMPWGKRLIELSARSSMTRRDAPLRPHTSQETMASGSPCLFLESLPWQKPHSSSRLGFLFRLWGFMTRGSSVSGIGR